jgi:hypothetical protein
MQGLTKAQEEIRALEGLRKQRLNKYQEALKKQAEIKTATNLSVQQLDEERKKLKGDGKTFRNTGDKSDIRQIDEKLAAATAAGANGTAARVRVAIVKEPFLFHCR